MSLEPTTKKLIETATKNLNKKTNWAIRTMD